MKSQRLIVKNSSRLNSPNSKSYADLPTLTSRSKIQPYLPYLNSTYTISIPEHNHLSTLRTRKMQETEITPLIVAKTLKSYFIPVFEAQRQRQKNLNTDKTSKFNQSLSEIFKAELKNSRKTLKALNFELKQVQRDKDEKIKEMLALKTLTLNYQSTLKTGKIRVSSQKKDSFTLPVNKFKGSFMASKKKNEKERKKLYLEKIQNFVLEHKATTLEHFHSLFKQQSTIMGERLKGLFFANSHLSTSSLNRVLTQHFKELKIFCVSLSKKELTSTEFMYLAVSKIQGTAAEALNKISERYSLQKELKMHMFKYNYERELYLNESKKNIEEKELSQAKFIELEKKSQALEEDYEKMYARIKEINKKRKLSENEEKPCKNCKKYYTEKDNFNWSCTIHPSEWGDSQFYYCCGGTQQEAPGCIKSKHLSDEDSRHEEVRPTLSSNKLSCISCGEQGHDSKNCSKDPNPKSPDLLHSSKAKQRRVKKLFNYSEKALDSDEENFRDIEISKKTVASFTSARHETWVKLDPN